MELPSKEGVTFGSQNYAMLIPAKLICIIKDNTNDMYAIIHSCQQKRKLISLLTYRWEMEYEGMKEQPIQTSPYSQNDNITNLKPVFTRSAWNLFTNIASFFLIMRQVGLYWK